MSETATKAGAQETLGFHELGAADTVTALRSRADVMPPAKTSSPATARITAADIQVRERCGAVISSPPTNTRVRGHVYEAYVYTHSHPSTSGSDNPLLRRRRTEALVSLSLPHLRLLSGVKYQKASFPRGRWSP